MPRGTPHIGQDVAEQAPKKRALLPYPPGGGGNVSEEIFWPYVESLKVPDDWSHGFGYLYRDYPLIDVYLLFPDLDEKAAKKKGVVKYIERFSEPFTRDTIAQRHGGGKYHIDFNDTNLPHGATICTVHFTIDENKYPPLLDLATLLVGHPDNKSYVARMRREGKLPPEGGTMAQPPQANDSAMAQALTGVLRDALKAITEKKTESLEGQIIPQMLSMMKTASDQAIQMAVGQVKQESPAGFLSMLTAIKDLIPKQEGTDLPKLITAIKELTGDKAGDKSNDRLFEMMMKSQEKQTELLMELIKAKTAPTPKSESDSFMKPLVEKLVERSLETLDGGGGGGSGRFDWRELIPLAIDRFSPTLTNLSAGFRVMMSRAGRANPADATTVSTVDEPAAVEPVQEDPMLQLLGQIAPTLIAHLRDDELTGGNFAEWLVFGVKGHGGGFGINLHQQITDIGEEKLLQMCRAFPALWAKIEPAGPERINEFLDQFFAWRPGDDEEEEEPDPTPIDAGKKKAAKKKGE